MTRKHLPIQGDLVRNLIADESLQNRQQISKVLRLPPVFTNAALRAESPSSASEAALYQALIENAPDGVFLLAAEGPERGRILMANRAAQTMYGYGPEEFCSLHITDLCAPALKEQVLSRLRDAHATQNTNQHVEVVRKDGAEVVVAIETRSLTLHGRLYVAEFHRNVTLESRSDQALRERNAQLQKFFDSHLLGLAFFDVDDPNEITEANDAYCRMIGCTRPELLNGRVSWRERTPPEYGPRDDKATKELLEGGRCQPFEKEYVRPDGTRIAVMITAKMFRSSPRQGALVVLDITDLWRARNELCQMQELRAHAARLDTLGEMAAGLAHELNQPLCAILTDAAACGHVLQKSRADDSDVPQILESIMAQAERAGEIIRRIRYFAQKREPKKTRINVNAIIRENADFLRADCIQAGIAVALELKELPTPVLADPVLIGQVLINLMRNSLDAMKLTAPNERRLLVSTRPHQNGLVEVAVADRGCGLSEDASMHLFRSFLTSKDGNLGLGLVLSRSIIESHGGAIWFTRNDGLGVTFHFTLPVESLEAA